MKRRSQRVKFRRRYASSLLTRVTKIASKLLLVGAVVVGAAIGLKKAKGTWSQTQFLQIKEVSYEGDIPVGLQEVLNIKPGENILSFVSQTLIKTAQAQFPELEKIEIHRTLNKKILVKGRYRTVLAVIKESNSEKGIDEKGVVFPMKDVLRPALPVPTVAGNLETENLALVSRALLLLQKQRPDFFALIKEIKTDKIFPFKIFLQRGIEVEWPEFQTENLLERADILLRFLQRYEPTKENATLKFITSDRLVMDASWTPIQIQK